MYHSSSPKLNGNESCQKLWMPRNHDLIAKESFSQNSETAKESSRISIANTAVLRACLKFLLIIQ